MTTIFDVLPECYLYVLLVTIAYMFCVQWMAIKVGLARKKHSVPYPQMYHTDPKHVFNCVQRAHQNSVESMPMVMFALLVGGLFFPRVMIGYGIIYMFSRVRYALGYYSGDPEKRSKGGFGLPLTLLMNLVTAFGIVQQLGYSPF